MICKSRKNNWEYIGFVKKNKFLFLVCQFLFLEKIMLTLQSHRNRSMSRLLFVISLFICISCAMGDAKNDGMAAEGVDVKVELLSVIDTTKYYPVHLVCSNPGNYPDNVIVTDICLGKVSGNTLIGLPESDIRLLGDSIFVMRNVPGVDDVLILCKGNTDAMYSAKTDFFDSLMLDAHGMLPIYADGALSADVNSYKWKSSAAQVYFSYQNHDIYQLNAAVSSSGMFVCKDKEVSVMGHAIAFRDLKNFAKVNSFMAQIEADISKIMQLKH